VYEAGAVFIAVTRLIHEGEVRDSVDSGYLRAANASNGGQAPDLSGGVQPQLAIPTA
jgi:hypothetical protein